MFGFKFVISLLMGNFISSLALGDIVKNGEMGKIETIVEAQIENAVEKHLEKLYGQGIGVNFDLKCLKHDQLSIIYCAAAYSTGGGTLGIISLKFDSNDLRLTELDRFDN